MRSRCKVTYGVYKNTELYVSYENKQLVFSMKPTWSYLLLGWLPRMLVAPTKELFCLSTADIKSVVVVDMAQLRSVYEFVMKTGEVCRVEFKKGDETSARLVDDLKDKLRFN